MFRKKLSQQVFVEILLFAENLSIQKGGWYAMKMKERVVLEMDPERLIRHWLVEMRGKKKGQAG